MKCLFKIVLFFLLPLFQGFSQTVPSDNSGQIKVYDSYQPKKGTSFGAKNKISINPLGVVIGDYPLYYERLFGNTFAVEVAAGVTHQNYIRAYTDFQGPSVSYNNSDVTKSYQFGSTFSISPKIYLNDDCFEGSYLALCFRNRLYKDEVTAYQGVALNSPMQESYKINSYTFNYGYVFHLGKGFMLDYYVGIGLRSVTASEFTVTYNSFNLYPYNNYRYSIEPQKVVNPTGMMGLKLGYTF